MVAEVGQRGRLNLSFDPTEPGQEFAMGERLQRISYQAVL
jgi:hypothetical protein